MNLSKAIPWGILLILSGIFVALLTTFRLPAAFLLGPMAAPIILAGSGRPMKLPQPFFLFAQGIIGCMVARAIPPSIFAELLKHSLLFLAGSADSQALMRSRLILP